MRGVSAGTTGTQQSVMIRDASFLERSVPGTNHHARVTGRSGVRRRGRSGQLVIVQTALELDGDAEGAGGDVLDADDLRGRAHFAAAALEDHLEADLVAGDEVGAAAGDVAAAPHHLRVLEARVEDRVRRAPDVAAPL